MHSEMRYEEKVDISQVWQVRKGTREKLQAEETAGGFASGEKMAGSDSEPGEWSLVSRHARLENTA